MEESIDHNRWDKLLAKLDVPEVRYKADLELHDRSQAFASELLKLCLGGIVVVGFLLANFPSERLVRLLDDLWIARLFSGAAILFALAAGSALFQRFLAGGALFHHLQVIKLSMITEEGTAEEIEHNLKIRKSKFDKAHWFLRLTTIFLGLGAGFLSVAFVRMLFVHL